VGAEVPGDLEEQQILGRNVAGAVFILQAEADVVV